ncbi:UNVERIFIED_CONTAM: putative late blight resistance proteinR1A-10 [Sesamum radiatum]|uniref:Late blight resistance proteinR1A-10 n=1 Tax=Sesamum radiatum TaxID=300843 RepID=A0AAW2PJQ4_SESRA
MAVAAYATLRSLSHVLDNLQHPARLCRLHVDTKQIQSFQEKVQFLLDFLEVHSQRISEEIRDLGRQIADVAAEAEEVVDRHVVDQLRDRSQEESHCMAALSSFCLDINKMIENINSLTKELTMKVKEEWTDVHEEQQIVSLPVRSSEVLPSGGKKSTMVGFDKHLERIVDELTRGEPDLQILPIVGMGGIGSHESYTMHFLDEDQSWNLFCQKAFAQEGCPYPELGEIGENIVKSCNGLPLAIVVIGGLLASSNMTREYWKFVAKNVNAFRNSKDHEGGLKILSLSYNNLPIHLKSCFLYMRVFPEDYEIRVSELTKLWIAEGFLKPIRGKSLEEVAEKYLRDLIDRNLILSRAFGYDGSTKTCEIHDLLRDLCLREYETEHFIYIPKVQRVSVVCEKEDKYFVCGLGTALQRIDLNEVHDASQLTSLASVLVCNTCRDICTSLNKTRLVRVRLLSKNGQSGESCEEEILHPTSLRYLEVKKLSNLEFLSPSTIALLWKQHTFTFLWSPVSNKIVLLPSEIWDMPHLRHFLGPSHVILPDQEVGQNSIIMETLHTVSNIKNFRCTDEVLERMPNLKTLGLSFLEEMAGRNGRTIVSTILSIYKTSKHFLDDLKWWRAENICFPNLERLSLSWMWELEEIPLVIGDIPTLHLICLEGCKGSLYDSAKQIVEEQHDNGNESLQLYIDEERYQIDSSS